MTRFEKAPASLAADNHFRSAVAQMRNVLFILTVLLLPCSAKAQTLPKVRVAYTSINIPMTPIFIMKDLDLARNYGLDAEVLMIPVCSGGGYKRRWLARFSSCRAAA